MSDAIERLRDGHRRFRQETYEPNKAMFHALALEQKPGVMVVACCDSRVDPATILGAAPGELFVMRNIANLVPPYQTQRTRHGTSAALEYAVTVLGVGDIVVMGHSRCGGVHAMLAGTEGVGIGNDFVKQWIDIAAPARERTLGALPDRPVLEQAAHCELENIKVSLENLMSFPCIAPLVQEGRLTLHGWHFDIREGSLRRYDPATDAFSPL